MSMTIINADCGHEVRIFGICPTRRIRLCPECLPDQEKAKNRQYRAVLREFKLPHLEGSIPCHRNPSS